MPSNKDWPLTVHRDTRTPTLYSKNSKFHTHIRHYTHECNLQGSFALVTQFWDEFLLHGPIHRE
jgi:hypothetical protein